MSRLAQSPVGRVEVGIPEIQRASRIEPKHRHVAERPDPPRVTDRFGGPNHEFRFRLAREFCAHLRGGRHGVTLQPHFLLQPETQLA